MSCILVFEPRPIYFWQGQESMSLLVHYIETRWKLSNNGQWSMGAIACESFARWRTVSLRSNFDVMAIGLPTGRRSKLWCWCKIFFLVCQQICLWFQPGPGMYCENYSPIQFHNDLKHFITHYINRLEIILISPLELGQIKIP